MKVLIWFVCILITSVIVTLITGGTGGMGFIPAFLLYGLMIWVARSLCRRWEERKEEKETEKLVEKMIAARNEESKNTKE